MQTASMVMVIGTAHGGTMCDGAGFARHFDLHGCVADVVEFQHLAHGQLDGVGGAVGYKVECGTVGYSVKSPQVDVMDVQYAVKGL